MPHRRRALVLIPATALALAACSSGTSGSPVASSGTQSTAASSPASSSSADVAALSADALFAKAKQTLGTKDVHIKGTATESSEKVALDMSYVGQDATGSMTVNGGKLTLLTVGGSTYFKADQAFWKAADPTEASKILAIVGDRWIKIDPTDSSFGEMASMATRDFLTQDLLAPEGKITKGEPKTIEGVDCLALVDTNTANGGTLYVDSSDAKPIQVVPSAGAKSGGELNFDYSAGTIPAAPAASDVLDFSALQGGN